MQDRIDLRFCDWQHRNLVCTSKTRFKNSILLSSVVRPNLTKVQIARGILFKSHVRESNIQEHEVKLNIRCSQNVDFIGRGEANHKFAILPTLYFCDFAPWIARQSYFWQCLYTLAKHAFPSMGARKFKICNTKPRNPSNTSKRVIFLAPTDEMYVSRVYANIAECSFDTRFTIRNQKNKPDVTTLTCDFPRPHRWNACFTNAEHAVLRGVLECAINTCAVWSECLARFVVLEVKAHSPRDSNANHILRFWPPGARKSTDVAFYDM